MTGPPSAVLATIPFEASNPAVGREIAKAAGVAFVLPQVDNIRTIDHSHMTFESTERFAAAFLVLIRPMLFRCAKGRARA